MYETYSTLPREGETQKTTMQVVDVVEKGAFAKRNAENGGHSEGLIMSSNEEAPNHVFRPLHCISPSATRR